MAAVQIVMENHRRRKEAGDEEEEPEDAVVAEQRERMRDAHVTPFNRSGTLQDYQMHKMETLAFDKNKFQERLVLEEAMCQQLGRCSLFMLQFLLFGFMLYLAYPSADVLSIHQGLNEELIIDGSAPADIVTPSGLKDYLKGLAGKWRKYSPGSLDYVEDPLARSYLGSEYISPPAKVVQAPLHPEMASEFTITAWVKTNVRYDTLLKKIQPNNNDAICWQFDIERILYGQHETGTAQVAVHPSATTIYAEGAHGSSAWKTSTIRTEFELGDWHHYAVIVNSTHAVFARDGTQYDSVVALERPITDCPDGVMTLGSDLAAGSLVDIKYIPRILSPVELSFIKSTGKLLDDTLAGSGQPAIDEEPLDAVQRMLTEGQTVTLDSLDSTYANLMTAFRKLEQAIRGNLQTLESAVSTSVQGGRRLSERADQSAHDVSGEAAAKESARNAFKSEMARRLRESEASGRRRQRTDASAAAATPANAHNGTEPRTAAAKVGSKAGAAAAAKMRSKASVVPPPIHHGGLQSLLREKRLQLLASGTLDALPEDMPPWTKPAVERYKEIAGRRLQDDGLYPDYTGYCWYYDYYGCDDSCVDSSACDVHMMGWLLGYMLQFSSLTSPIDRDFVECLMEATYTNPQWVSTDDLLATASVPDSFLKPPDGSCDDGWRLQESSFCVSDAECMTTSGDNPCYGDDQQFLGCRRQPGDEYGTCATAVQDPRCPGHPECLPSGLMMQECARITVRPIMASAYEFVERYICSEVSDKTIMDIKYQCPYRCSQCKMSTRPTQETTIQTLMSCSDNTYEDWLGESCSWYMLNDQEAGEKCRKYGTTTTQEMCSLTCGTCAYTRSLTTSHDQNGDGYIDSDEMAALYVNIGQGWLSTRRYFGVSYQMTDSCVELFQSTGSYDGFDGLSECVERNSVNVSYAMLMTQSFGTEAFFSEAATNLIRTLKPLTKLTGLQSDVQVTRFPTASQLTGSSNMALQQEAADSAYPECTADTDCEDMFVFACGNPFDKDNKLCNGLYQVPMYCASRCFTGGCGANASVLPNAAGQFCQPCDACYSLEAAGASATCPSRCADFEVDASGSVTADIFLDLASTGTMPTVTEILRDQDGSFALSAWIKNFDTQWIFERRINLTRLNMTGLQDFEGYDVLDDGTEELVCWQLGPNKLQFRNRWSQQNMTVVDNPLKEKITGDSDWHHILLRKESVLDKWTERGQTFSVRREELFFFVDGEKSTVQTNPWGGDRAFVDPYGFPDCGGEMLSIATISQNLVERPTDLLSYGHFQWDSGNANEMEGYAMPLAMGHHGSTALTFAGLYIPAGAFVKTATVQLCAARHFMDWLDQNYTCGSTHPHRVKLKIAGLHETPSPTMGRCFISEQASQEANENSTDYGRTNATVTWDIDVAEWRTKGHYQTITGYTVEDQSATDCAVFTPDVTTIIAEMLERDSTMTDFTLVVVAEEKDWGSCATESIFDHPSEVYGNFSHFEALETDDECGIIKKYTELFNYHTPLWIIPMEDTRVSNSILAKLFVQYCLNEECVSPSFLGSGNQPNYVQGMDTDTARNVMGIAPEPSAEPPAPPETRRLKEQAWRKEGPAAGSAAGAPPQRRPQRRRLAEAPPEGAPSAEAPPGDPRDGGAEGEYYDYEYYDEKAGLQFADNSKLLTSMYLGATVDKGMTTDGLLYNPLHVSRALMDSEVQTLYYNGLTEINALTGPVQISDAVEKKEAKISQYPRQVVGIIPPVVFQRRSPVVPCRDFTPGLASAMDTYFAKQLTRKCTMSYTCDYPNATADSATPSGFACVDRTAEVAADERWFDTGSLEIGGSQYFPTFLDMFSVPTLFKGGDMRQSMDWIDVQTTSVMVINMFISPGENSGTILQLEWEVNGQAGQMKLRPASGPKSYVQMSEDRRQSWFALVIIVMLLSIIDAILIIYTWISRTTERKRLQRELELASEEEGWDVVNATPIVQPVDVFDTILRAAIVVFCIYHILMYPGPETITVDGQEVNLESYDARIKEILELRWEDPLRTTEEKVSEFMDKVVAFDTQLNSDEVHRTFAKVLILAFFVRVVIYTRVHPRIAILYKTMLLMLTDFIPFCMLFFMLFFVLAFLGLYSFGDQDPNFMDFGVTCYTQFRMLVGEYNMPDADESGFDPMYAIYIITYFFMAFSLLLNFFLAIVIDSFALVKDMVKECEVENPIMVDIHATMWYPIKALSKGWPQRAKLLKDMMKVDVNADGLNDEDQDEIVPIDYKQLIEYNLAKDKQSAIGLLQHYMYFCPALIIGREEKKDQLEHLELQHRLNSLDTIRFNCALRTKGIDVAEFRKKQKVKEEEKKAKSQFPPILWEALTSMTKNKSKEDGDPRASRREREEAEALLAQAKEEKAAAQAILAEAQAQREELAKAKADRDASLIAEKTAALVTSQVLARSDSRPTANTDAKRQGDEALSRAAEERRAAEEVLRQAREETGGRLAELKALLEQSMSQVSQPLPSASLPGARYDNAQSYDNASAAYSSAYSNAPTGAPPLAAGSADPGSTPPLRGPPLQPRLRANSRSAKDSSGTSGGPAYSISRTSAGTWSLSR